MECTGSKPLNVLLTGARAPVALELARLFHRAGHGVFVAESMRGHLCRRSVSVRESLRLPAPNQGLTRLASALTEHIERHNIDLLIPTCEEVFYVSMVKDRLPSQCTVFTDSIEKLRQLHSKKAFVDLAKTFGLAVPETREVSSREELEKVLASAKRVVLKPTFSRFANDVVILPRSNRDIRDLEISTGRPWVVQEFLDGPQRCTYAIAIDGAITARSTYDSTWRAGKGASIFFRSAPDERIDAWVETFVRETKYTGQIAFDFITTKDGRTLPLECNPRATSGIHLFGDDARVPSAFIRGGEMIEPDPVHTAMLGPLMFTYGLPSALWRLRFGTWLRDVWNARDVFYQRGDAFALFGQVEVFFSILGRALRHRVSLLQATTTDIEWNGDEAKP